MRLVTTLRVVLALALGALLPHAVDALLRSALLPGWVPGLRAAIAWALVGLPAAWLTARIAGSDLRRCALGATIGGLLSLAAPFVVYALPIGPATLRLLWLHLLMLGVAWPTAIVWLGRGRRR